MPAYYAFHTTNGRTFTIVKNMPLTDEVGLLAATALQGLAEESPTDTRVTGAAKFLYKWASAIGTNVGGCGIIRYLLPALWSPITVHTGVRGKWIRLGGDSEAER